MRCQTHTALCGGIWAPSWQGSKHAALLDTIQAEPSTSGSHCAEATRSKHKPCPFFFAPATLGASHHTHIKSTFAVHSESWRRLWGKTSSFVLPSLNFTKQYLGIKVTSSAARCGCPVLQPVAHTCTPKRPHKEHANKLGRARERTPPVNPFSSSTCWNVSLFP